MLARSSTFIVLSYFLFFLGCLTESGLCEEAHTNRLINESSPYLLKHATNPVDWHPWGEEALSLAKAVLVGDDDQTHVLPLVPVHRVAGRVPSCGGQDDLADAQLGQCPVHSVERGCRVLLAWKARVEGA